MNLTIVIMTLIRIKPNSLIRSPKFGDWINLKTTKKLPSIYQVTLTIN